MGNIRQYLLYGRPAADSVEGQKHLQQALTTLMILVTLVAPISWLHYFVWSVFGIGVIIAGLESRRSYVRLALLLFAGFLLRVPMEYYPHGSKSLFAVAISGYFLAGTLLVLLLLITNKGNVTYEAARQP